MVYHVPIVGSREICLQKTIFCMNVKLWSNVTKSK